MISERHGDAVVVWAPAKVNLHLEVLAKRADGYHEIATLMVAVSLYDTLEFKEDATGEIHLHSNQPELSTGPDNLVYRAAALLRQRSGHQAGVAARLTKRIPLAAGLAGGSTDAAATLAGLNELWNLGLTGSDLVALAGELGSDVAFFFSTPAAWCTGRGEQVAQLTLGRPLWFVLVCPDFGLSTAEVYGQVTVPQQPRPGTEICDAAAAGNAEAIGRLLHNRLQPAAERLRPALTNYLARLATLGPAGRAMSGSGTTLFALCRNEHEALRIAREFRSGPEQGMTPCVYVVRSCS